MSKSYIYIFFCGHLVFPLFFLILGVCCKEKPPPPLLDHTYEVPYLDVSEGVAVGRLEADPRADPA